jgi:hypothetical protein
MDAEEIVAVIAYVKRRKQKLQKIQKLWVHPFVADRPTSGMFCKIYSDLRKYPDKFFNQLRLSIGSFDELLTICENDLTTQDTILRKSVSAEEKLFVRTVFLQYSIVMVGIEFQLSILRSRNCPCKNCNYTQGNRTWHLSWQR